MASYDLPGGKKVTVSDNLPPQERLQIAEDIKTVYGVDINEVSVLDRILDAPKSIARGAAGLVSDVPLGLAGLADIGDDSKVVKRLQSFQDYLREDSALASDPELRDKYTTKLAEGVGSFVPFFGAGLAGRALAQRGIVGKKAGEYGIPAALAIPSGMAQQVDLLQSSRDMGEEINPVTETLATLLGGVIGASEILPIQRILSRIPKSALRDKDITEGIFRSLKSAAKSGALEGGQEVFASVAQDLTAAGLYSDKLPIADSILDEFTIGGIIGGSADLLFNSINKRGIDSAYHLESETKHREKRKILNKRFGEARKQKTLTEIQEAAVVGEKPDIPVPSIVGSAPKLNSILTTEGKYSVIDIEATESPVLETFDDEVKAKEFIQKQNDQFETNKLKSKLDNDLYSMGYSKSPGATNIGAMLLDKDSTEINLQSLINSDSRYKGKKTFKGTMVASGNSEQLSTIKKYIEKKKLPFKTSYTMTEAKKFLNAKDFNALNEGLASTVNQVNNENSPDLVINSSEIDVSDKAIKQKALLKNIDLDFDSKAFNIANKIITGAESIKQMSRGQRELLIARIDSLPSFKKLTPLPSFNTRNYDAQDMADFVSTTSGRGIQFNAKNIELYLIDRFNDINLKLDKKDLQDQVDSFVSDLETSGRAEKLTTASGKKSNSFKIKDNFEFDIESRAEAFNETPQEFEARLVAEGTPQNIIDTLVEEERVRQEKVTKPVEPEPKEIDFAETVQQGRTNKFAKEIRKKLRKLGLGEVGVIVSNDILSTKNLVRLPKGQLAFDPVQTRKQKVEGEYDSNTDTIFLSLNAVNPDGLATDAEIQQRLDSIIDAQVIHAFRAKDLINESEYNHFRSQIKSKKVPSSFDKEFGGLTFYERSKKINEPRLTDLQKSKGVDFIDEFYIESAIAELYKGRNSSDINVTPRIKKVFQKFLDFFKGMGVSLPKAGYKKSSEIFSDIEDGTIGGRERNKIRTLREIDRLPSDDTKFREEFGESINTGGTVVDVDETIEAPLTPSDIEEFGIIGATFPKTPKSFITNQPIKTKRGQKFVPNRRTVQKKGLYDDSKLTPEELSADKEYILNNLKNKNLIGVMEWYTKNAPGRDYKTISSSILKQIKMMSENFGVTYDFTIVDKDFLKQKTDDPILAKDIKYLKDNFKVTGNKYTAGVAMRPFDSVSAMKLGELPTPGKYRIYINNTLNLPDGGGVNFDTILHESVHAATSSAVALGRSASQLISEGANKEILNRLQGNYGKLENLRLKAAKEYKELRKQNLINENNSIEYGLTNSFEFLAVGLTNRDFQSLLENIEFKQEGGKTLWDGFVKNIRKILGLPAKSETVFSEFLKVSDDVINLDASTGEFIIEDQKFLPFAQAKRASNPSPSVVSSVRFIEEIVKKTPNGDVPPFNLNASDTAINAAVDYIYDESASEVKGSQDDKKSPKTFGERIINEVADPTTEEKDGIEGYFKKIKKKLLKRFRVDFVDDKDAIAKFTIRSQQMSEKIRIDNQYANTRAEALIRMADKSRGTFGQMLTIGTPTAEINGDASLTKVKEFIYKSEENNLVPGKTAKGGLLQITAPLFVEGDSFLENIFKEYATIKRVQTINEKGQIIATPPSARNLDRAKQIENNYKNVVEVYNNYQGWNNELIKFAKAKGLVTEEQAKLWILNSTYYPFYREMVDDQGVSIDGERAVPSIGGGMLPANPLGIKMTGSEKELTLPPLEVITRNSLSILTAALKNDGASKLAQDMVITEDARKLDPRDENFNQQKNKINVITVYDQGNKEFYELYDMNIFEAVQSTGGVNRSDLLTKFLSFPSSILRDTVTRDPGFVIVNVLRDTLSTAVTSGARLGTGGDDFTPVYDSFKNLFGDITELERFGIIGGYDFANDEGDVVKYMARLRRQEGLEADNTMTTKKAFFKIWDGLGGLTTKSDGATRKAIYDVVYEESIKEGATEAQAQSEAAYQALEIINFGRRGASPMFRIVTSAIPFLNARIQGVDVLYRSFAGEYSATQKLLEGESQSDLKKRVFRNVLSNGLALTSLTILYYLMVSGTDDYEDVTREQRDDNWIIPTPFDFSVKIPIPFEIGMLFKALPERVIDMALGQVEKDPVKSIQRQLSTSLSVPFISGDVGVQALKPLFEAINNNNTFTGQDIVPYYRSKMQPGYQSRPQTNELFRILGEGLNISPMKIEHVVRGYTGTLGGYVLAMSDTLTRTATGSPYMPNNIMNNPTNWTRLPILNRLFLDNAKVSGLQQGFYELRAESQKVVQTLNSLRDDKRFDELAAYKESNMGVISVKSKIKRLDKYLKNYRNKRDRIISNKNLSSSQKEEQLDELNIQRNKRLAIVPTLREKADVPSFQVGL